MPKVGEIVEVKWRDSGASSARTGIPPEILSTLEFTNWGKVVYVGESDLILAYSEPEDGDLSNTEHWAVWIPAVISCRVLK